ncbi:MAG TPA: GNAT family N-acetyltransferase [Vicinamibacterales bacterium]|nr:GNAT family N-acetyltransferase [Vicinamibacterales bacterium]
MDLQRTCDVDEPEYIRFLDRFAASPGTALAYHYPFYLRFLAEIAYPGSRVRFCVARSGGQIVGVLPSIEISTDRLHVELSLPYFGPNGGALVAADVPDRRDVVSSLVRAATEAARERGCGSMTIYTPLGAEVDAYLDGFDGVDYRVRRFSQWLEIAEDPAMSPWPAKVRYSIRRASSKGVVARRMANEAELDVVWEMYSEQCLARSIPVKPREHIRALYRSAGDRGSFLLAEHEGRIIGGLICFMGGGVISYYLPVTHPEARELSPAQLLLDAAAAIGRDAGCRRLNFEGSPSIDHPVYQFKAHCGGMPVSFDVLVKLLRPGVLDEYRALTPAGLASAAPQAFIVPFNDITH